MADILMNPYREGVEVIMKPPCQSLSSFPVKVQYPLIVPQYFVYLSLFLFLIGKWSWINMVKHI